MKIKRNKLIIIALIVLGILVSLGLFYVNDYYHADKVSFDYLKTNDKVKVTKISDGYFFDGYGNNKAIIFYPGAKVETESYSKLMYDLADNGVDCFLIDMPLRIAFLGKNKADEIIDNYKYDEYIMMGHSLGGVVATLYLNDNNKTKSIIYLASYPNNELKKDTKMLSIYGSNDKVLSKESYNKSKPNWSDNYLEYVIDGGNHSGFANYGEQKGDGKANIDNIEQQQLAVNKILEFVNN